MLSPRVATAAVFFIGVMGLGASCNRSSNSGSSGTTMVPGNGATEGRPESGTPALPANAVTEINGLDLSALRQPERERFWAVANDELSPCGDPHSLAVCARDSTCASCGPALRFLTRRVADGFPTEALGELLRARYARNRVSQVRIEGAPIRGAATAPVTLVEFSDYECPHCGRLAPVLRDVEREFEGRLRVIHLHFPLPGHIHAAPASRAAVAASRQGRFWEYHDLLFANQTHLETADLERYATQLNLNMDRFRADMLAAETEQRVETDRREGTRLEIRGTPTLFINGRRYPEEMPLDRQQLREWIQEEIQSGSSAGSTAPAPSAPAPSAQAAPAAPSTGNTTPAPSTAPAAPAAPARN